MCGFDDDDERARWREGEGVILDWSEEHWIKLYTRDTPSWVLGPWEARAVLAPGLRKLDRAGGIDLGDDGIAALAAMVSMPLNVVEAGMAWWIKRGTFRLEGTRLVMPNFREAQKARASAAQRMRELRARSRALRNVTAPLRDVTGRSDQNRIEEIRSEESGEGEFALTRAPGRDSVSVKKTKARKPPKHTAEEIAAKGAVVDAFVAAYEAKKGCKPVLDHGGEHAAAFKLAKAFGSDEACAIVRRAFEDPFVADKNTTLCFIESKANTYRGTRAQTQRNAVQPTPAGGSVWEVGA